MTVLVYFSEAGQSIIRTIDVILFQVLDSLEHIFFKLTKKIPKFILEKFYLCRDLYRGKHG